MSYPTGGYGAQYPPAGGYGGKYPPVPGQYPGAAPAGQYPGATAGYPGVATAYSGTATAYPGAGAGHQYPGAATGYPGAAAPVGQYPGAANQQYPKPSGSTQPLGSTYPGPSAAPAHAPAAVPLSATYTPGYPTAAPHTAAAPAPTAAPYIAPAPAPYVVPTPIAVAAAAAAPRPAVAVASKQPKVDYPDPNATDYAPPEPLDALAFYNRTGFTDAEVLQARTEYVDDEPDMCMTDTRMYNYAGTATFAYYKFMKWSMCVIFFFFIMALINFLIYTGSDASPTFASDAAKKKQWYYYFFISEYNRGQRAGWLGTTIVSIIAMFVAALFFYRYIGGYEFDESEAEPNAPPDPDKGMSLLQREIKAAAKVEQDTDKAEDTIVRFEDDGSIDVSARYRTNAALAGRRFVSLLVFVGFLVVQVFASIQITKLEKADSDPSAAFAIAFIAVALNLTYQVCARQLTEVEKWMTRGSADMSLTFKLVLFKLCNVIAVFAAKDYPSDRCVYEVIGEQFMTLLFAEIVVTIPLTVLSGILNSWQHQLIARLQGSIGGDHNHMAQFDMAIEYLATMYKFYLTSMAMVTFPMATAMGLFAFFFEFWASRYRLIKVCGKPIKVFTTMRGMSTTISIFIFFATLFTPFSGAIWILAGWSESRTGTDTFCRI